jgi:hypothetical protein
MILPRVVAMPWKTDIVFLACCVAWLFCMPVLAVVSLVLLIGYAMFSILWDCFYTAAPEPSDAREVAQHLCFGSDVRRLS